LHPLAIEDLLTDRISAPSKAEYLPAHLFIRAAGHELIDDDPRESLDKKIKARHRRHISPHHDTGVGGNGKGNSHTKKHEEKVGPSEKKHPEKRDLESHGKKSRKRKRDTFNLLKSVRPCARSLSSIECRFREANDAPKRVLPSANSRRAKGSNAFFVQCVSSSYEMVGALHFTYPSRLTSSKQVPSYHSVNRLTGTSLNPSARASNDLIPPSERTLTPPCWSMHLSILVSSSGTR
jgi:hypothetical protein